MSELEGSSDSEDGEFDSRTKLAFRSTAPRKSIFQSLSILGSQSLIHEDDKPIDIIKRWSSLLWSSVYIWLSSFTYLQFLFPGAVEDTFSASTEDDWGHCPDSGHEANERRKTSLIFQAFEQAQQTILNVMRGEDNSTPELPEEETEVGEKIASGPDCEVIDTTVDYIQECHNEIVNKLNPGVAEQFKQEQDQVMRKQHANLLNPLIFDHVETTPKNSDSEKTFTAYSKLVDLQDYVLEVQNDLALRSNFKSSGRWSSSEPNLSISSPTVSLRKTAKGSKDKRMNRYSMICLSEQLRSSSKFIPGIESPHSNQARAQKPIIPIMEEDEEERTDLVENYLKSIIKPSVGESRSSNSEPGEVASVPKKLAFMIKSESETEHDFDEVPESAELLESSYVFTPSQDDDLINRASPESVSSSPGEPRDLSNLHEEDEGRSELEISIINLNELDLESDYYECTSDNLE